ncbi:hypothetical protein KCU68_g263, partial [Aureobasidium melanogenum]
MLYTLCQQRQQFKAIRPDSNSYLRHSGRVGVLCGELSVSDTSSASTTASTATTSSTTRGCRDEEAILSDCCAFFPCQFCVVDKVIFLVVILHLSTAALFRFIFTLLLFLHATHLNVTALDDWLQQRLARDVHGVLQHEG